MSNMKQEFWLPVFIKSQMEIPVSHESRGRKIQEVNKFFFSLWKVPETQESLSWDYITTTGG